MPAPIRPRHPSAPSLGFTLIEVLVAVLVGLLVLAGAHRIFVAGLTTQTTTSLQTEVNRKAQVALDDIVFYLRGSPGVIGGDATRIHFADQTGLNTVRYWLDSGRLYRAINTNSFSGGIVLASNASQLTFTYSDQQGLPTTPDLAHLVTIQLRVERSRHSALLKSTVRLRNKT